MSPRLLILAFALSLMGTTANATTVTVTFPSTTSLYGGPDLSGPLGAGGGGFLCYPKVGCRAHCQGLRYPMFDRLVDAVLIFGFPLGVLVGYMWRDRISRKRRERDRAEKNRAQPR